MTGAEAKTKWCPAARVLLPVNQTGNRISTAMKAMAERSGRHEAEWYAQQEADCRCIGSGCMAWRWQEELFRRRRHPVDRAQASSVQEPPRPIGLPPSWKWNATYADEGDACWIEPIEEANARRHGYCGLAGAPGT